MKMGMTMSTLLAAALMAGAAGADDSGNGHMVKVGDRMVDAQKLRATIKKVQERKTGGVIRLAGSAQGLVTIVNCQTLVGGADLEPAAESVDKWLLLPVKTVTAEAPDGIGGMRGMVARAGGTVGVVVIDDAALPGFLTAPEDGWAVVNVRRLASDAPDPVRLAERTRKEILRGVAFVTGGAYLSKSDAVMRDIRTPADLDHSPNEGYGLDTIGHIRESAPFYGVSPWRQATYKRACEEGWAPAPTNDIQRAIWEQIRSEKELGPSNALKIEPKGK